MSQPPKSPPDASPGFPFSPQEAMEFMQRMWNPLGIPIPGFAQPAVPGAAGTWAMPFPNPAAMFATLDPAEIQRKIDELKIVENWLTMNVHLIQMSIKTMELQMASLEAMRAAQSGAAQPPQASASRKKS